MEGYASEALRSPVFSLDDQSGSSNGSSGQLIISKQAIEAALDSLADQHDTSVRSGSFGPSGEMLLS